MEDYSKNLPMLQNRVTQMGQTLAQVDKEIEKDKVVIGLLSKADDETRAKYGLDEFIKTVQEQIDSYGSQRAKLVSMIERSKAVIEAYDKEPKKYAEFLDDILVSFGFGFDTTK